MYERGLFLAQVLVTGSHGFIGKHLIERLVRAGFKVKALSRRSEVYPHDSIIPVLADLTEPSNGLNEAVKGCELIFHCAGETHHLPSMRKLHVQGTQNLLDAALNHGSLKHWVQLSSVGVYGHHLNEAHAVRV